MRTTAEILAAITDASGRGDSCPLGLDLFTSAEVLQNEDLHRNYDYKSAVHYLMRIRPDDAGWIEAETNVAP